MNTLPLSSESESIWFSEDSSIPPLSYLLKDKLLPGTQLLSLFCLNFHCSMYTYVYWCSQPPTYHSSIIAVLSPHYENIHCTSCSLYCFTDGMQLKQTINIYNNKTYMCRKTKLYTLCIQKQTLYCHCLSIALYKKNIMMFFFLHCNDICVLCRISTTNIHTKSFP